MRRIIVTAITILVCFLLQTSVFDLFRLADTVPNVLLILVSSVSVMRGQKEGMLTGFFSGLLLDMFYGSWLEDLHFYICSLVLWTDCFTRFIIRTITFFRLSSSASTTWYTVSSCFSYTVFCRIIWAFCFTSEALYYRNGLHGGGGTDSLSDPAAHQRLA